MKLTEITDDRPMIWQIAASLLAQGKKIDYAANIPGAGEAYHLIGRIEKVGLSTFILDMLRYKATYSFSEDDDEKLTMIKDPMSEADFKIIDLV